MAKAKFKVGDKVKVIGANGFNDSTSAILEFIGKTGEITEVRKYPDGDIGYCFHFETNGMEDYCFDGRSLEKVVENKNWFNIDIRSEGDRTVAYYIDRNGEQKVSVLRYKDDEYDPKVAIDYLMQKVEFSGAKACIVADDDWHCGDLVMWNDEKAEIVAMSNGYLLLDFKFENVYSHDAKGCIIEGLMESMVDKDGKPWKSDGQPHYYIVSKDDEDLELLKAVRKVDVKIPEAPKTKPNPKDFPFAIGDRVHVKEKNDNGTVVAYNTRRGSVLAHMDNMNNIKDTLYHKGNGFGDCTVDADGNPFKADKSEYWWVDAKTAEKIEDKEEATKQEIKYVKDIEKYPFAIGKRVYIPVLDREGTVVALDKDDHTSLVKVDNYHPACHTAYYGEENNSCVDENGEIYECSGKSEYFWLFEKRDANVIDKDKDNKKSNSNPSSNRLHIGDRVMCTYEGHFSNGSTQTGYGTVVAYSNSYGLENGYLVEVDSEYRGDIPCHDGLKVFYDPYTEAGKKWTNETGKCAFRYFDDDSLKKVK